MTEIYFIIKNDTTDMYKIEETDSDYVKSLKTMAAKRDFATFDSNTKTWTIKLPQWFCESEFEDKALILESFYYFKPDGTMDLGTSFHCPLLSDGLFAQHDNMICMANDGIERIFYIDGRQTEMNFWFRDYLSNDNLDNHEILYEQKKGEKDQPLWYYTLPTIGKHNFVSTDITTTETLYPVLTWLKVPGEYKYYYLTHESLSGFYTMDWFNQSKDFGSVDKYIYPIYYQTQQVWYNISKHADVYETTEVTDYPVLVPFTSEILNVDYDYYIVPSKDKVEGDIAYVKHGETPDPSLGYQRIYSYKYDNDPTDSSKPFNKLYYKIFETTYEEKDVPVLSSIKFTNGDTDETTKELTMYLTKQFNGWVETFTETEYPMFVPKPCWKYTDKQEIMKSRYYLFRDGITLRKTTTETELPVYIHLKNDNGVKYYAEIGMDVDKETIDFKSMILEDYVPTTTDKLYVPVFVNEYNDANQKLYWEVLGESTVDTGDPVIEEKDTPSSFVIITRLRC